MSKIKVMLDEDVDVTDPRDTGNYGEPESTEPSQADWSISELNTALDRLEKCNAHGYVSELITVKLRLNRLIQKLEKPF